MNLSTDSSLKFLVGFMFLGIITLSGFILSPNAKDQKEVLVTTKSFGEFIAKNPNLVDPQPVSRDRAPAQERVVITEAPPAIELNIEQRRVLTDAMNDWNREEDGPFDLANSKPVSHDARWRGKVESVLDVIERTPAVEALDFLKSQIMLGYYDADSQNKIYAKVWIERYLRVETRDYQRKQIQNLLNP